MIGAASIKIGPQSVLPTPKLCLWLAPNSDDCHHNTRDSLRAAVFRLKADALRWCKHSRKSLLTTLRVESLFFDGVAAQQAVDLMGRCRGKGRPGELRDAMIAGIVLVSRDAGDPEHIAF